MSEFFMIYGSISFVLHIIIAIIIIALRIASKAEKKLKQRMTKQPADGTDWLWYDDTAKIKERIKQQGKELRQITYKEKAQ